jgi:multiple sugar transport system permease protein
MSAAAPSQRRSRARMDWRYIPLVLWAFFVAFPIYWMVVTSFKNNNSIYNGAAWIPWVDFQPVNDAWPAILTGYYSVIEPLKHSLIIATSATVISMFVGSLAGYGLARFRVKAWFMRNNDIAFWIISQRIMPPVVVVLAYFILYKDLGLLDTLQGMIIIYTAVSIPLVTWFMENYFKQLPVELEDAAYVDGANRLTVFLRVALPLARPGIIATALLAFSFSWNELLFALMLTSNSSQTLPVIIAAQTGESGTFYWNICAISIISIAPMILVAIVLQKRLVTGLLGGALK